MPPPARLLDYGCGIGSRRAAAARGRLPRRVRGLRQPERRVPALAPAAARPRRAGPRPRRARRPAASTLAYAFDVIEHVARRVRLPARDGAARAARGRQLPRARARRPATCTTSCRSARCSTTSRARGLRRYARAPGARTSCSTRRGGARRCARGWCGCAAGEWRADPVAPLTILAPWPSGSSATSSATSCGCSSCPTRWSSSAPCRSRPTRTGTCAPVRRPVLRGHRHARGPGRGPGRGPAALTFADGAVGTASGSRTCSSTSAATTQSKGV